jgi:hypothetical protein
MQVDGGLLGLCPFKVLVWTSNVQTSVWPSFAVQANAGAC